MSTEPPELGELMEELFDVKRKWYNIGLQLKVSDTKLDEIESACGGDFEVALRRTLQEWRKQLEPRPTWSSLVKALRSRTVDEQDLAANLEDRFAPAASARSASRVLVPFEPAAGIDGGVLMQPDEVPDPEVQRELDQLYQSFDSLRMDVYTYLNDLQPDLNDFAVLVSSPAPSWKTKRPKPVTDINLDRIMNPETQFHEKFCIVCRYVDWYNYELLEKIVKRYGNPELKRKMEEYRSEVDDFESRTSAEVLKHIVLGQPLADSVTVIARLENNHCNQFTGRDIRRLKCQCANEAGVDPATIRLHIIVEHSVEIVFLVPIALAPYLLAGSVSPLLTSQSPLPENMYERCVHIMHAEEIFHLMGRTVTPPVQHKFSGASHTHAHQLSRSVFSSESLTSETSRTRTEGDNLSLYPSLDPSHIHVFHNKILMNGENAVVCKAQFLHLPCAAKYLHHKLAESSTWQLDNFYRGCKILQSCHHPNIITCLGMLHDDSLRVPILLMELMDHSLKEFLDQDRVGIALPLHIEIDICYDIAQGLEYLHAKDIIHGNLTATNILLREGRAKICGVMSLQHSTMDGELSLCPGAPEILPRHSFSCSDYTETIDCFSFGVLAIHITTQEIPSPLALAHQSSEISEIERYANSLEKVDNKHPLHPIIRECLNDESTLRPSAGKLCSELSDIRQSANYDNSQIASLAATRITGEQLQYTQKQVKLLQTQLECKQEELKHQEGELTEQLCLQKEQAEQEKLKAGNEKENMENRIGILAVRNKELEEKNEAAMKDIERYKCEANEAKKRSSEATVEKERMCKDLWGERGKTDTMGSKIKQLEKEKTDYKDKLEQADAQYAKRLSQAH